MPKLNERSRAANALPLDRPHAKKAPTAICTECKEVETRHSCKGCGAVVCAVCFCSRPVDLCLVCMRTAPQPVHGQRRSYAPLPSYALASRLMPYNDQRYEWLGCSSPAVGETDCPYCIGTACGRCGVTREDLAVVGVYLTQCNCSHEAMARHQRPL